MPDNVDNSLQIIGSDSEVKKVLEFINGYSKSDEMHIDFNKIIPMPDDIKNTSSNSISDAVTILLFDNGSDISESELAAKQDYIKNVPVSLIKGERQNIKLMYSNTIKYGHASWYEWVGENWLTKWNAYNQYKTDDNTIFFCTAWSSAFTLMLKLSERFPEVSLNYTHNESSDFEHYHIYELKDGDMKYYKDNNWAICSNKDESQIEEGSQAQ